VSATLDPGDTLTLLERGELEVVGRLVDASNATLFCHVQLDGATVECVYKPVRGERPLWDFPDGTLARRERAAYLVSEAFGWDLVPPTVLREGAFGSGMVQLWVHVDEDVDVVELVQGEHPDLRRMAVLDTVINNADRKGGHVLIGAGDRVYGVDHGVSFHVENKLRTVLWGWTGRPLPPEAPEVLATLQARLDGDLGEALEEHLTVAEVQQVRLRVRRLARRATFPQPPRDWPAVPWPPV
jgi:hypothetical protein